MENSQEIVNEVTSVLKVREFLTHTYVFFFVWEENVIPEVEMLFIKAKMMNNTTQINFIS